MNILKAFLGLIAALIFFANSFAQNPIIPGYFADPSIKKFDDNYYIYATTDGHEKFGIGSDPLVWISDNLVDWTPKRLIGINIEYYWAPAVIRADNNKFYLYNTHGVNYTGMVWESENPIGPWTLKNEFVGFDIEPFKDPKTGKFFLTTNANELLELDSDVKSDTYMTKIVEKHHLKGTFPDLTEGVYLFMKDNLYYMMWSGGRCWQENYNVHYATSKSLLGPYIYGSGNPIIETNEVVNIYGPGHHSVILHENNYFLVYHRQDRDHEDWCDFRFTCMAKINFNGTQISSVEPINDLASYFNKPRTNLALDKYIFASDEEKGYQAKKAVDGDLATRWMGPRYGSTLTIDLGEITTFSGMRLNFEYPDKYVTYKVELSDDFENWNEYENHLTFAKEAWEIMDIKKAGKARFVRIFFGNVEGRTPSLWEWQIWE